ncbi:hypothetical protein PVL29_014900 [Vitis rotundifolia]|uniref:Uncharacterized protein n=1 Tax=Vitis rotundifolia TaxID=103349 RepID=A0AA39DM01_VITRO|nr:hypothetical protein PVL29_014900 [Vitis rotundifolia]
MYSHSQFDGNAAFSGGGFMPSQATQAAEHAFSPARNRDTQALLPLTVKQISEAFLSSDDKSNFLIDGVEVNNVTLVGMVFNKAERVTDVGFTLDDGTGRIDCNRWVNEAVDSKEMEGILDGMYVRVHGHLKGFQGKRHLNAFSIRPVTDFNEIGSHFIECIYVHIYNTKSRVQAGGPTQSHVTNPAIGTPLKGYQASQPNQFSGQYGAGLKGVDQMVIDYLQQPQSLARDQGVGRDELAQKLNVPVDKIMESIRSLEEEGLIYSTIDEWHYKSTGNG